MLSAMAFERLLAPRERNARGLASAFSDTWQLYKGKFLRDARRIKGDGPYVAEQAAWPFHRKWMKELYEARSASAHRGRRSEFSVNWAGWQHLVIAAFAYPLTIMLLLQREDFYTMTDKQIVACEVLDELLDSNWKNDVLGRPAWPSILSDRESDRELDRILRAALATVPHAREG